MLRQLDASFETFFDRYPNKDGKPAAKRFWIKTLKPLDGSPFLAEIMEGQAASLEWGVLRRPFPPTCVRWLMNQHWKDLLPPTRASLIKEYERDPVSFMKERAIAVMVCVQREWGTRPTLRQEALSVLPIPREWLTAPDLVTR